MYIYKDNHHKTTTTTTTSKPSTLPTSARRWMEQRQAITPMQAPASTTREDTRARLEQLQERRNALALALTQSATVRADFRESAHALCETVAQIAVYKTLLFLYDSPNSLSNNASEKCGELLREFPHDIRTYQNNESNASDRTFSDAFDLFKEAYVMLWGYLSAPVPLTLADTVRTHEKQDGTLKEYNLFNVASQSVREYINAQSRRDDFKRIQYFLGYTEEGKQITTGKRPKTDTSTITDEERAQFARKYNLTAREQEVIFLVAKGESAQTISALLNIDRKTAERTILNAKKKFPIAYAYDELRNARNAQKVAERKAKENAQDKLYQEILANATNRTKCAHMAYRKALGVQERPSEPKIKFMYK